MRVCHITPHLPPDQAANALLPIHLGEWSREAGDEVDYVAYAPREAPHGSAAGRNGFPGSVVWLPPRDTRASLARSLRLTTMMAAIRAHRAAGPIVERADVVHLHSNGLLTEVGSLLAWWKRKPTVLTLYGTEIWHYRPRAGIDLFTRAYRRAGQVTFYSRALLDRAKQMGLHRAGLRVIYPPVAPHFVPVDARGRLETRASLGITESRVLLNVKRLHPLAGQRVLLEAMPAVLRDWPDTRLVFCGTGPLLAELQSMASALGIERQVTFAGLVANKAVGRYYVAADLFVLPSILEACPTVAVEALACGTPVVSSDNPGGVELRALGLDVTVVPREDPAALARAIGERLKDGRRADIQTAGVLEREFRPEAVAARFAAVYRAASQSHTEATLP